MGEFVSTLGNPWLASELNVTRQGEFLKKYGAARAQQFAEAAARENAKAPRQVPPTYIFNRRVTPAVGTTIGGGSIIGAGSSGDGPPA